MNERKKDALETRKTKALEQIARELKRMNDISGSTTITPTKEVLYSTFGDGVNTIDPLEVLGVSDKETE